MKRLMPIFLITSIKLKTKAKSGSSGNLFSNTIKKTAIIVLLHLKFLLQEYKRGKMNLIYDIETVTKMNASSSSRDILIITRALLRLLLSL